MATIKSIIILIIAALASLGSAKEYIVGGDQGWSPRWNLQEWAANKNFFVGDKVVFKYPPGKHNVVEVNDLDRYTCRPNPLPGKQPLTSGNDVITLDTPGIRNFICGIGDHCGAGMSLGLVVQDVPPGGKEYMVGDDKGWTTGVDYQAWVKGKEFLVGDKLIFKYPMGKHNVFPVTDHDYYECRIPAVADSALASGNDVFPLASAGNLLFICGIGNHCQMGMKLSIVVKERPPSAPTNQGSRRLKVNS